jgi:phosphatidylethanolamine-binding protein (PEBP) family uncharacterized protein
MKLTSTSFADGQKIPGEFAFCIPNPDHHVCLGSNRNPQLAWSGAPAGTRSFAAHLPRPRRAEQGRRRQPGRPWRAGRLPRVDFFHWVLVDLPPLRSTC